MSECVFKRATRGIPVMTECFVSGLHQCPHPGVTLYENFARCYHWGKMDERYMGLLFIISHNTCDSTMISR